MSLRIGKIMKAFVGKKVLVPRKKHLILDLKKFNYGIVYD